MLIQSPHEVVPMLHADGAHDTVDDANHTWAMGLGVVVVGVTHGLRSQNRPPPLTPSQTLPYRKNFEISQATLPLIQENIWFLIYIFGKKLPLLASY